MSKTYHAPTKGDLACFKRLHIDNWHVAISHSEVEERVRDWLGKAEKRADLSPVAGDRTRKAWVRAAQREHDRNLKLYKQVMLVGV